jgi:hypothetical protein
MGVGKSTVGRLLAERLGAGYRDTDDDIVAGLDTENVLPAKSPTSSRNLPECDGRFHREGLNEWK